MAINPNLGFNIGASAGTIGSVISKNPALETLINLGINPFIVSAVGTGTGTQPSTPTSVDLQLLLNAIPIAQDGNVITSEYHNALRAAVLTIANQLGVSLSQTVTLSFAPSFLPSGVQPQWVLNNGFASKPTGGTAHGWFPLQLPDGARIQSMTAIGRRSGTVASFQVQLLRQPITDTDTTTLITIPLNTAGDPFTVSGNLQVAGAGPTALEEYRVVDNDNYKYLAFARLVGAAADAVVELHAIRVTFNRS
jgi:hypothetical protein